MSMMFFGISAPGNFVTHLTTLVAAGGGPATIEVSGSRDPRFLGWYGALGFKFS